jgi:hypothetical protein
MLRMLVCRGGTFGAHWPPSRESSLRLTLLLL